MLYFECEFPVRYYETDQMGIVHHSNYIRYFECARSAFMKDIGYTIQQCEADGIVIPVVNIECTYKYSAKMGDMLKVSVGIDKAPSAKLIVYQKVINQEGRLCAEGKVTLGFLDKHTGKIVVCPKQFVQLIQQNL